MDVQDVCSALNIHIPPMAFPPALSLLLDHQGSVHWDTAGSQDVPPHPLLLLWAADKRPQRQGLPTCQDRTWHCGRENEKGGCVSQK